MKTRLSSAAIAAVLAVSALAACGSDNGEDPHDGTTVTGQSDTATPDESVENGNDAGDDAAPETREGSGGSSTAAEWPRTVSLGDSEVTIEEAPSRIVAVSAETAEIALLLAGPERIAAVPSSAQGDHSTAAELASQVEQVLPPGTDPDPEMILSMEPDLVLNTARHGGEETAGDQLKQAGVPVLNIDPDSFSTPEKVAETVRALGDALGEEELAEQLSAEFLSDIEDLDSQRQDTDVRFLALMARGDTIMAMDDSLMLPGLITRAHASNAGQSIGLTKTRPIDAEQIVAANPDVIFLEDFQGMGEEPFTELLENPALATVPAVAEDRIFIIPMSEASGISGLNTAEGYRKIIEALAG